MFVVTICNAETHQVLNKFTYDKCEVVIVTGYRVDITLTKKLSLRKRIEQIFSRNDQPYIHEHMVNQIMDEIDKEPKACTV